MSLSSFAENLMSHRKQRKWIFWYPTNPTHSTRVIVFSMVGTGVVLEFYFTLEANDSSHTLAWHICIRVFTYWTKFYVLIKTRTNDLKIETHVTPTCSVTQVEIISHHRSCIYLFHMGAYSSDSLYESEWLSIWYSSFVRGNLWLTLV